MSEAPGYLPQGYKKSTRTWRVDGPPESANTQTEHWDGRLDATVHARPVSLAVQVKAAQVKE